MPIYDEYFYNFTFSTLAWISQTFAKPSSLNRRIVVASKGSHVSNISSKTFSLEPKEVLWICVKEFHVTWKPNICDINNFQKLTNWNIIYVIPPLPSKLNGWLFSCSAFWGVVQGVQRCFLVRLVLTSYRLWAESFFCLFLLMLGICRCRYPVFNEKHWHVKKYLSWLFSIIY